MKNEVHYDPQRLALVSREMVVKNFKVEDEDYKVGVMTNVDSNHKLARTRASKIVALAVAGALALGASSMVINILSSPSTETEIEVTSESFIVYNIPAEVTGLSDITVKVLPDGRAFTLDDEDEFYNGKRVSELVFIASSKGMLYRDFKSDGKSL